MALICKKIPTFAPPQKPYSLDFCAEGFVDITAYSKGKIKADMQYIKMGLSGAISLAIVREGVAKRLLDALSLLPLGYTFKVYDAWRPFSVQKAIYDSYFEKVKEAHLSEGLSEEQLHALTRKFVSFPKRDVQPSFVHSSGGAVDLTIIDADGNELDMGTGFDDFTPLSMTSAFEHMEHSPICQNRRLLYSAMTEAGFTNYHEEWWHYDFGDIFYGQKTGENVIYDSVFDTNDVLERMNVYV